MNREESRFMAPRQPFDLDFDASSPLPPHQRPGCILYSDNRAISAHESTRGLSPAAAAAAAGWGASSPLTSLEDFSQLPFYESARIINKLYAERHGYLFFESYAGVNTSRKFRWHKVKLLKRALQCCCRWALYLDSDAYLRMDMHRLSVEEWAQRVSKPGYFDHLLGLSESRLEGQMVNLGRAADVLTPYEQEQGQEEQKETKQQADERQAQEQEAQKWQAQMLRQEEQRAQAQEQEQEQGQQHDQEQQQQETKEKPEQESQLQEAQQLHQRQGKEKRQQTPHQQQPQEQEQVQLQQGQQAEAQKEQRLQPRKLVEASIRKKPVLLSTAPAPTASSLPSTPSEPTPAISNTNASNASGSNNSASNASFSNATASGSANRATHSSPYTSPFSYSTSSKHPFALFVRNGDGSMGFNGEPQHLFNRDNDWANSGVILLGHSPDTFKFLDKWYDGILPEIGDQKPMNLAALYWWRQLVVVPYLELTGPEGIMVRHYWHTVGKDVRSAELQKALLGVLAHRQLEELKIA